MNSRGRYIILQRHGQTEDNGQDSAPGTDNRVLHGASHSPLTSLGEEQARSLGRLLKSRNDLRIRFAAASKLERAMRSRELTLEEAEMSDIEQDTFAEFNERTLGEAEEKTIAEIELEYFGEIQTSEKRKEWISSFSEMVHVIPDAENYRDVQERVTGKIHDLLAQRPREDDILITMHQHAIRCALVGLGCLSEEQAVKLKVPNDQFIIVEEVSDGEFIIAEGVDEAALQEMITG